MDSRDVGRFVMRNGCTRTLNIPRVSVAVGKYSSDSINFIGRETLDKIFEPVQ